MREGGGVEGEGKEGGEGWGEARVILPSLPMPTFRNVVNFILFS